jgi:hypothetical protein
MKTRKINLNLLSMNAKKLLRNKKVIEEINRHKWLESEIAGYDIGFEAAAEDWLKRYSGVWVSYHAKKDKSKFPPIGKQVSRKAPSIDKKRPKK